MKIVNWNDLDEVIQYAKSINVTTVDQIVYHQPDRTNYNIGLLEHRDRLPPETKIYWCSQPLYYIEKEELKILTKNDGLPVVCLMTKKELDQYLRD